MAVIQCAKSDRGRGFDKFISKLRNSRRSGKIDLSCILVWDGMDCITVGRLLLVPAVNVCETIKNWFQLIYQNLSWLQYCVLLPCVWLQNILRKCRGGARHFHLGGPLEGPVLQQGELSMVCVGLSERDLKNFWGARQNFGEQCSPWNPPSSAPVRPP